MAKLIITIEEKAQQIEEGSPAAMVAYHVHMDIQERAEGEPSFLPQLAAITDEFIKRALQASYALRDGFLVTTEITDSPKELSERLAAQIQAYKDPFNSFSEIEF